MNSEWIDFLNDLQGYTMGIPLKSCRCFPEPGSMPQVPDPDDPENCDILRWTWPQKCLELNGVKEGDDPFGGWAHIAQVYGRFKGAQTICPGMLIVDWGQSDPSNQGKEDCKNLKTGNCNDPCNDIWLWVKCCKLPPIED